MQRLKKSRLSPAPTAFNKVSDRLVAIRLPKEMYSQLAKVRQDLGVPVSRIVREALSLYLDVANYDTILHEHQKAGRVYTEDQISEMLTQIRDTEKAA